MNKKKDSLQNPVKTKVFKQKTIAVKSKIKGAPAKRPKSVPRDKIKGKPAPVIEAGYSLYSTASENSLSGEVDTCSELLARLKERRKESFQSDNNTPFNQRLSSSTPDPEKFSLDQGNVFQTVPERDRPGPVLKEPALNRIYVPSTSITHPGVVLQPSSGIHIPFGYYGNLTVSQGDPGNHGNIESLDKREVVNTTSSGFIPAVNSYTDTDIQSWSRRDSDIQTYQAYIPRESIGFAVDAQNQKDTSKDDSKGNSSGSSGAKEISQLTSKYPGIQSINSSGTDYVVLPGPQGGTGKVIPPGTPVLQLQNGLFQIRPANYQGQGQNKLTVGNTVEEKHKTPSPGQHDLGGSYLSTEAFLIPERDNGPSAQQSGNKVSVDGIAQETLSTITGNDSHHDHHTITPISQRTTSVSLTPRTESSGINEKLTNGDAEKSINIVHCEINRKDCSLLEKQDRQIQSDQSKKKTMQERNLSGSDTLKRVDHVLQEQNVNPKNVPGTNVSELSAPGQIFILQPQGNTSGGNTSSFQLVPVSILPKSDLNSSVSLNTQHSKLSSTVSHSRKNVLERKLENVDHQETPSGEKSHVDIPNPWSKVKMDAGLKKLRYLLGELRECGKIGKDIEVTRLVKEVEKTIETIPTLSSKFNLVAEIDLCLQPLRNENCQLRRKLRLANQQLKEREAVKEKAALDFDVIHLQASNNALQKQIAEEKETKVKLAHELKELHSQIQRMKIERNKLLAALSEKETDELKIKQECLSDTQKFRLEIEQLQQQTEAIQVKHETLEQENHILQITLQERDSEINKMQEVVSEVKDCVASLIQELEETKGGEKSFISNNSFSLQKLVRVLGEESVAGFSQSKPFKSTQKEGYPWQSRSYGVKEQSPTRLTEQALATHNKGQMEVPGVSNHRSRYFNCDNGIDDYKTSTSDTEVELNVENYKHKTKKSPPRRGQSLSPPSKRTPLRETTVNTASLKQGREFLPKSDKGKGIGNRLFSAADRKNPRVAFDISKNLYRKDSKDEFDSFSNVQQSCNQSEASRYSVTDYFQKYPLNKPDLKSPRSRFHHRSYSQPNYNKRHTSHDMNLSEPKDYNYKSTDSDVSPRRTDHNRIEKEKQTFSPQDHLFQGTYLDNSLSAITDDNISSVSERTSTSTATTINDTSFRRGIAALDANILKLQLALQKTKSMLS